MEFHIAQLRAYLQQPVCKVIEDRIHFLLQLLPLGIVQLKIRIPGIRLDQPAHWQVRQWGLFLSPYSRRTAFPMTEYPPSGKPRQRHQTCQPPHRSVFVFPFVLKRLVHLGLRFILAGIQCPHTVLNLNVIFQTEAIQQVVHLLGIHQSLHDSPPFFGIHGQPAIDVQALHNINASIVQRMLVVERSRIALVDAMIIIPPSRIGFPVLIQCSGKSQVTVEYDGNIVKRIDTVVVSTQHSDEVSTEQLRKDVLDKVIKAVLPSELLDENTKYFINPTGRFEIGGPHGDSGLTGRKIIVDTYGGSCPHGGGAFSGKDPTKVDRSAAYMARYICKNVVAAGLAKKCTLELSYAIGVAKPISVFVNTEGTGVISDGEIADVISKEFDLRPYSIIKTLDLRRPIYRQTAAYGHFGRSEFPWERLDRVKDLKAYILR